MIPQEKLDSLIARFETIEKAMETEMDAEEIVRLSKEHAELRPVVEAGRELTDARRQVEELGELAGSDDPEMAEMAGEELEELKTRIPEIEHALQIMLLPRDKADKSASVILEVRAGTGGDEAALFAGDLFRMYQRYTQINGWKMEIISASESDVGGYKEVQASVSGEGVFARLKFESGVHRVQRVPETETQGRVHTSAATVAMLPEPEEVDIEINESDLRVDVFRASGPGGQSVNTTDSAVRITHLPTGLVVSQQDEKSQHKNRAKAMKVLRARLYEAERARADAERAAERKGQVGSGDRSERIRTYNFPQSRVTDHRINLTLYKLDKVIAGEALDELVDALITQDQADRLAAMETDGS
ncbi:peptide chain release factor 1 [Parvularcula sp. IMCC14364]|uniref:peptide chain release factor 1 n=1 Tax=Parvularcula sp. IMCC14364 TaxID=3067902 RepID=UPI002740ADCF|nr:peptide chain release factor 1 [Parvularcula sp. IMCC14364]